jgi:hypothetical protein
MRLPYLYAILAAILFLLFLFLGSIRDKQHAECVAFGGIIVQNECLDSSNWSDK